MTRMAHQNIISLAVLYYTSQYFICWDFVGMTIQDLKCVGIDPNSCHPKPRPSAPRNFLTVYIFSTKNKCTFTSKIYIYMCWDFVGMTIQTMINH